MQKSLNIIKDWEFKLLFLACIGGILSFYILEFFFELRPCELCLIQRIPYFIGFFLCFIYFFKHSRPVKFLLLLCFLVAVLFSIFQILVEEGFIIYSCNTINAETAEELQKLIYKSPPSCFVKQSILGIRVTFLALFYNLILFILSILTLIRKFKL